jgi:hypothetical protein
MEGGLQELSSHFCRVLGEFALPPGSIILFSSLSHLHTEGLANYASECINVVRRFNSMFKGVPRRLFTEYQTQIVEVIVTSVWMSCPGHDAVHYFTIY